MQIYPYVIQELRSTLNELGSSRQRIWASKQSVNSDGLPKELLLLLLDCKHYSKCFISIN